MPHPARSRSGNRRAAPDAALSGLALLRTEIGAPTSAGPNWASPKCRRRCAANSPRSGCCDPFPFAMTADALRSGSHKSFEKAVIKAELTSEAKQPGSRQVSLTRLRIRKWRISWPFGLDCFRDGGGLLLRGTAPIYLCGPQAVGVGPKGRAKSKDKDGAIARRGGGEVSAFLDAAKSVAAPGASGRGRLIFALDATMSRQPTWDLAQALQARMFEAAGGPWRPRSAARLFPRHERVPRVEFRLRRAGLWRSS